VREPEKVSDKGRGGISREGEKELQMETDDYERKRGKVIGRNDEVRSSRRDGC